MSNKDEFIACKSNNINIQPKETPGSFTANKLNNQAISNSSNITNTNTNTNTNKANSTSNFNCVQNRQSMDISATSSISYPYTTPIHTPIKFNDRYLNKSYRAERLLRISERSPELRKPSHLFASGVNTSNGLTRTRSFNPGLLLSNTVS